MRVCVVVCPAPALGLATSPAGAQEAEVLRRELEQLTQPLRATQEQDQKVIQDMRDGPQRLQAQPSATPPPPAMASTPTVAPGLPVAVQPRILSDLAPEAGPPTGADRAIRAVRGPARSSSTLGPHPGVRMHRWRAVVPPPQRDRRRSRDHAHPIRRSLHRTTVPMKGRGWRFAYRSPVGSALHRIGARRANWIVCAICLASALGATVPPAAAQGGTVTGIAKDALERPLPGADVRLETTDGPGGRANDDR
jgi:hypothetical protein